MPKITVLMPSLNVVKYIRPCVESVLGQTLQDLEILAIDAGSEDGTLAVLEEYAARDGRLRIIRADRKSYGYQLNIGIVQAQGDYIGIVETDDMILPDMYEVLYNTAVQTDAEYVKGRHQKFVNIDDSFIWTSTGDFPLVSTEMSGEIIAPHNMPELLLKDIYLWTGIYEKEFIKKIKLNETSGAAFQDQGFLFQTISSATRAVYLDQIVYQYRQDNSNSSIFNKKGFSYIIKEYDYIKRFLTGKSVEWIRAYYTRMLNQCIGRFEMMAVSGAFWNESVSDMEFVREELKSAVKKGYLRSEDLCAHRLELLEYLLQDVRSIYLFCADELHESSKAVCNIMRSVNHKEIVIFGCGRRGQFLHALLTDKRIGQIQAFCDNDSVQWDRRVQGITVLSPDEAVRRYPEAVYMIGSIKNDEAIKAQLQEMGIDDVHIYLYRGAVNMQLFRMNLK